MVDKILVYIAQFLPVITTIIGVISSLKSFKNKYTEIIDKLITKNGEKDQEIEELKNLMTQYIQITKDNIKITKKNIEKTTHIEEE